MLQDVKVIKGVDGIYDIPLTADGTDLESISGLETAIIVSLFTDARASIGDVQDAFRRKGWSGNLLTLGDNFELGSTLWTMVSRLTQTTLIRGQDIARQSLDWMVSDGIVDSIQVTMVQTSTRSATININIFKALNQVDRYTTLWDLTQRV